MRPIRPFSFHGVLYRSSPYNSLTNTIANTIIITIEPTNSTAVTTTPRRRRPPSAVRPSVLSQTASGHLADRRRARDDRSLVSAASVG